MIDNKDRKGALKMKIITAVFTIIFCIPVLCIAEEFKFPEEGFTKGQTIKADDFNNIFRDIEKKMAEISVLQKRLEDVEENMIHKEAVLKVLPIGTIIPSMIAPANIDPNMKEYFVPCDGELIPRESAYAKMVGRVDKMDNISDKHRLRVPDLRGQFIRGLNYFDDPKEFRKDKREDPESNRKPGDYQADSFMNHSHSIPIGDNPGAVWGVKQSGKGGFAGGHARKTSGQGKNETRPKNVAVFYYIKIN
jgi:hypothetical protein